MAAVVVVCVLAVAGVGPLPGAFAGRSEGAGERLFAIGDLHWFMARPSDLPPGFRVLESSTDPAACLAADGLDQPDRSFLDRLKELGLLGCRQRSFALDVPGGDVVPVSGMAFLFGDPGHAAEALGVVAGQVRPPGASRSVDLPAPDLGDEAGGSETRNALGSDARFVWRSLARTIDSRATR